MIWGSKAGSALEGLFGDDEDDANERPGAPPVSLRPTDPGSTPQVEQWGDAAGDCWVMDVGDQHASYNIHDGVKAIEQLDARVRTKEPTPLTLELDPALRGPRDPGQEGFFAGDIMRHTHTVTLSVADLKALSRGESVSVMSSPADDKDSWIMADGHRHEITFSCVRKPAA